MGDKHFRRPIESLKARAVCRRVEDPLAGSTSKGDILAMSSSKMPSGRRESIWSIAIALGFIRLLSSESCMETSRLECRFSTPLVSIAVRLSFHRQQDLTTRILRLSCHKGDGERQSIGDLDEFS